MDISPTSLGLQPSEIKQENQRADQAAKDFEAVFLTQFVDQMMKTTGSATFGSEKNAEMWRSFMSEAVAKQLVEQGGLGLTGQVRQMLSAYTETQNDRGTS